MLWDIMAYIVILPTIAYYYNIWPLYDPRIILDGFQKSYQFQVQKTNRPCPQYLKYMTILMYRYTPFLFNIFICSGMYWHTLPFFLLLDIIARSGTYTTLRFSWIYPAPNTWHKWVHWYLVSPPSYNIFIYSRIYSYALGYVDIYFHSPYQ